MPATSAELLELYRATRTLGARELGDFAFQWLRQRVAFDSGSIVTSSMEKPSFVAAHFYNVPDPRALLASWEKVSHLDALSPTLLSQPARTQRQDFDDPRVASDAHKPLREHLVRFQLYRGLSIAVPDPSNGTMTVVMLHRHTPKPRFTDADVSTLDHDAPHVMEAWGLCHRMALSRHAERDLTSLPIAFADRRGHLTQLTPAFRELFFGHTPPSSPHLSAPCLAAIEKNQPWPLPDGRHCLHRLAPEGEGWLLRIRPVSRADLLTPRERQVAKLYGAGASHREIAAQLALAPATVRNQIQSVYAKLGVRRRAHLSAALSGDA